MADEADFVVVYTGTASRSRSDLSKFTKEAGGVSAGSVGAAVRIRKQSSLAPPPKIFLVQGEAALGGATRKTKDAQARKDVDIISEEKFLKLPKVAAAVKQLEGVGSAAAGSVAAGSAAAGTSAGSAAAGTSAAGTSAAGSAAAAGPPQEPPSRYGAEPKYGPPQGVDMEPILAANLCEGLTRLSDAPEDVRRFYDDMIIPGEIFLVLVLVLGTNPGTNAELFEAAVTSLVLICKACGFDFGYVGASMRSLKPGVVTLDRSVATRGFMAAPGRHKKTSHFTGRSILLNIWLPETEQFLSNRNIVCRGESNIYDAGGTKGIKFCNFVPSLGCGLSHGFGLYGDQAAFSLYFCEQTPGQTEMYLARRGFTGRQGRGKSGNANAAGEHVAVYFICDDCGGYISTKGPHGTCGNPTCAANTGVARHARQMELVEDKLDRGFGILYAGPPCHLCRKVKTRNFTCTNCVVLRRP